ncbi:MAG: hypothetical protein IJT25_01420 [Clostridia bacterium]|nr:hypothetical protein [Clostridia bacterium]
MKRFWITTGIVFGLALLFVVGLGVILILAPGSRIMGLQYVSAFIGKNDITEEYAEYIDGDIYVKTRDIPVVIDVQPYGKTKVEFSQHYHGYTTDKDNVPNCKISRTVSGIEIETQEVVKFLFGGNDAHFLKITVPSSWALSGRHSIYVNGENSPITLQSADDITLKFVNLTFNANNILNINTKLNCKTLTAYTRKNLELNKDVVAENYNITTAGASINFVGDIEGNLTAKTSGGSVHFTKVKGDVNIKTGTGEVAGVDDKKPIIYGSANIETGRGRVVLDELLGENNNIKTASGSITIETILEGNIASPRGKITIGSIISGEITGGNKDVVISSIVNSATISSTKGNIYVGDLQSNKIAKNITISSTNGKIVAKNTVGSVSITTTNGDVVLYNSSANDISVSSGKTVVATGLLGKVNISAKRDINIAFNKISGDVEINGTANCRNINITANKTKLDDVNVYLSATKGGTAFLYEGEQLNKSGLSIEPETVVDSAKNIRVNAPNCNIKLYLSK